MRLCFLGDVRSTHIQKFVKYFSRDHETHLISFDYVGDNRVQPGIDFFKGIGTNIHFIKKFHILFSPFIVRRIVHMINPDLVQAHFVTNYGFLGAFSEVHPLVISAMGDDILIHPSQSSFYNYLVTYALRSADFVTCDGINSMHVLNNTFEIPREKSALIYPGIDMSLFHPIDNVIFSDKIVFYPRGFDKVYDTDTLFLVMKIIHEHMPKVKFILLGVGTELERFKSVVTKSSMNKSVLYLGYVPNNKLPLYYTSSKVSVTTSLSDGGIPVSTIEAMACGIPVVSTDAGDAVLWVQNRIAGYVVPKQDPIAMAKCIMDLLNDEETRIQFGKKARQIVETAQDYNSEMKKVEELYIKLIKEHRK